MTIDVLPSIERDALILLLSGTDATCRELHSQLAHVVKVERNETGAGVYAVFRLDGDVKSLKDGGTFQLSGVFAVSEKCGEIGFLLYVKDGLIDCLEAYVYEDTYPRYSDCDFKLESDRKN
ncbi:hypothetical protein [Frateuria sp. STR12]|uniref:hypothetical protein n=1 Tax=Frateuria hangzhouensis TaxID=2995589 RepID=UPI002260D1AD|nr:hypothetical protein [Frateuria sp. STR12]MCX7514079.1 hypothetical protein [Frateuria sp. STR12]